MIVSFNEIFPFLQVQENSPGEAAGLEAFFDFIVAIGSTRLVNVTLVT